MRGSKSKAISPPPGAPLRRAGTLPPSPAQRMWRGREVRHREPAKETEGRWGRRGLASSHPSQRNCLAGWQRHETGTSRGPQPRPPGAVLHPGRKAAGCRCRSRREGGADPGKPNEDDLESLGGPSVTAKRLEVLPRLRLTTLILSLKISALHCNETGGGKTQQRDYVSPSSGHPGLSPGTWWASMFMVITSGTAKEIRGSQGSEVICPPPPFGLKNKPRP
nr:uncharacterized protein LOC105469010 isoform X1 [Macaca nemestrina]